MTLDQLICKFVDIGFGRYLANKIHSWVFSSSLPASSKTGHNIYTPSQSSTYQALSGYTWDISYADGSGASGTVGTDTVTIGSTTVNTQAVELATTVSSTFVQDASDGLVGLAFSSINTGMAIPCVFETVRR